MDGTDEGGLGVWAWYRCTSSEGNFNDHGGVTWPVMIVMWIISCEGKKRNEKGLLHFWNFRFSVCCTIPGHYFWIPTHQKVACPKYETKSVLLHSTWSKLNPTTSHTIPRPGRLHILSVRHIIHIRANRPYSAYTVETVIDDDGEEFPPWIPLRE